MKLSLQMTQTKGDDSVVGASIRPRRKEIQHESHLARNKKARVYRNRLHGPADRAAVTGVGFSVDGV